MDNLLREAKEKFILEGQKAYIAINGAAAAAMLAFLQAVWEKKSAGSFIIGGLIGLMCFAIGASLGALTYVARHCALTKGELAPGGLRSGAERGSINHWFRAAYWYLPLGSIAFFIAGLLITAISGIFSKF